MEPVLDPWLASNIQSCSLGFQSAGITGVCNHTGSSKVIADSACSWVSHERKACPHSSLTELCLPPVKSETKTEATGHLMGAAQSRWEGAQRDNLGQLLCPARTCTRRLGWKIFGFSKLFPNHPLNVKRGPCLPKPPLFTKSLPCRGSLLHWIPVPAIQISENIP